MAFSVEAALGYLARARAQNRLAHAYLVTAADGRRTEELAAATIRMVNGDSGESLESLLSGLVYLVRPESKSRRISLAQIHALEKKLHMGAPEGKTKVAVIQEADRLGPEAENAFLKTLEEPPAGSLILLLSSQPQRLLETILSRCLRISLRGDLRDREKLAEEDLVLKVLVEHLESAGESVSASLGLAGRFAEILKGMKTEIVKRYEQVLKEESKRYEKRTEGDWLAKREDYYKALGETEYLEKRDRLVEALHAFIGDALRQQNSFDQLDLESYRSATAALAARCEPPELIRRFAALEEMRTMLETNTNEKLVFEVSFLEAFG